MVHVNHQHDARSEQRNDVKGKYFRSRLYMDDLLGHAAYVYVMRCWTGCQCNKLQLDGWTAVQCSTHDTCEFETHCSLLMFNSVMTIRSALQYSMRTHSMLLQWSMCASVVVDDSDLVRVAVIRP